MLLEFWVDPECWNFLTLNVTLPLMVPNIFGLYVWVPSVRAIGVSLDKLEPVSRVLNRIEPQNKKGERSVIQCEIAIRVVSKMKKLGVVVVAKRGRLTHSLILSLYKWAKGFVGNRFSNCLGPGPDPTFNPFMQSDHVTAQQPAERLHESQHSVSKPGLALLVFAVVSGAGRVAKLDARNN